MFAWLQTKCTIIQREDWIVSKVLQEIRGFWYYRMFVTAPHITNVSGGDDEAEDNDSSRGWWFSTAKQQFKAVDKTELDVGFRQSVDFVLDRIDKEGPFDGIFAFSQGACMLALMCALRERKEIELDIKFAIFSAAFLSRSTAHKFQLETRISLPTLHIIGETDQVIAKEMSDQFLALCENPVAVVHPGGHYVPSLSAERQTILSFLQRFTPHT